MENEGGKRETRGPDAGKSRWMTSIYIAAYRLGTGLFLREQCAAVIAMSHCVSTINHLTPIGPAFATTKPHTCTTCAAPCFLYRHLFREFIAPLRSSREPTWLATHWTWPVRFVSLLHFLSALEAKPVEFYGKSPHYARNSLEDKEVCTTIEAVIMRATFSNKNRSRIGPCRGSSWTIRLNLFIHVCLMMILRIYKC